MDNKTVLHAAVMSAIEAMMKTDRKAWITLLPVLDRELLSEVCTSQHITTRTVHLTLDISDRQNCRRHFAFLRQHS